MKLGHSAFFNVNSSTVDKTFIPIFWRRSTIQKEKQGQKML